MARRDPKKCRPGPVAGALPGGGESKLTQGNPAPAPPQAARRVPTIQEPADPVLREIHVAREIKNAN